MSTEASVASPAEVAADASLVRRAEHALAADARLWTVALYAAVALGCVVRLLRFVDNPALWLDESFMALNLMQKSFTGILGQLQHLQSAPPGFLLVEKASEAVLGDGERSLRLFGLVASLASVVAFAYAARRVLAAPAAVLAIVFFAFGEPLLERAAEIKPYSVDLAVATILIALTLWVVEAPSARLIGRTAVFGVSALVGVWFSFPAAFIVAACVVALAVYARLAGSRRLLGAAAVVGAVSLVSFGVVYAIASANVGRVSAAIFAGGENASYGRLSIVHDGWSALVNPGGFDNGTGALAAVLVVFGLVAFSRRASLHLLALFGLPLLLAAAAGAIGRYPLQGRWSLYLVPALFVLVARGAQELVAWSRRPVLVAAVLGVFLVASPIGLASKHVLRPPAREDVKPLLVHLVREWRPGDTLYVYGNTQYALRYYSTCRDCSTSGTSFPWPTRLAPPGRPGDQFAPALESVPPEVIVGSSEPVDPIADFGRLPAKGRIWLIFSHVRSKGGLDDEQLLLSKLGGSPVLERIGARGASLYLIDRTPG